MLSILISDIFISFLLDHYPLSFFLETKKDRERRNGLLTFSNSLIADSHFVDTLLFLQKSPCRHFANYKLKKKFLKISLDGSC